MVASPRRRLVQASAFTRAARRYWLGVFAQASREIHRWHEQALSIPDARLRELALATQRGERGNLEGAAAFAVLAPRARRREVVHALVAFQALYDYLDTLAEQPCADPRTRGRSLHLALLDALDPARPRRSCRHDGACDGGYVEAMVECCRAALAQLPGAAAIRAPACQAAERMVAYQSLIHSGEEGALRDWAVGLAPCAEGLDWWEAAAGAASSLGVFALIALAADDAPEASQTRLLADAYFPWIGALHVLLDSLADHSEDECSGHLSLVAQYANPVQAAARLGGLAARARAAAAGLQRGALHELILAAMSAYYLSQPSARAPGVAPARGAVLAAFGPTATPAMTVLALKRAAETVLSPRHDLAPEQPRGRPLLESQV